MEALIMHFSLVCCYLTALCLNISLGTLVSNAFHLFSSLRMRDQVSPPYIIIIIVISVEVSGVDYDRAPNETPTRTLQHYTTLPVMQIGTVKHVGRHLAWVQSCVSGNRLTECGYNTVVR
jgi:uncharacterized paraquat-inducible protein A